MHRVLTCVPRTDGVARTDSPCEAAGTSTYYKVQVVDAYLLDRSAVPSLEAALGSTAEARGSFEHGKRVLLEARAAGKLPPEGQQALAELEGNLRRLPRDE